MKNISIQKSGRLGNFIIKIKNALYIALFYNYNIILPIHEYFNTTYINKNNIITCENEKIVDKYNFFYSDKVENIDNTLFQYNTDKVLIILKSIFVIKDSYSLDKEDVLIHIRSGDIFKSINMCDAYITPPLSYYIDIIKKNMFKKIYLIAEDINNPCINELLKLYPNIYFKLQTLEEDIKLILGAINIIMSFGTFIPQLLHFSEKIKTIYAPNYVKLYKTRHIVDYNLGIIAHYSELTDYYERMFPWKNTIEQKDLMLSYKSLSPKTKVTPKGIS